MILTVARSGIIKTKQGLPNKQSHLVDKGLTSGNKEKKGFELHFHTGNANLHIFSLHLSNFLLLGTTAEYPNLPHNEN